MKPLIWIARLYAKRLTMKNYLNIVECAIEHDGKFLIIKRPLDKIASGLLSFPGGKVEAQDTQHGGDILKFAAKREVLEEVGISLLDPLVYITSDFTDIYDSPLIISIFHCVLEKSNTTVIPSEREVPEYYWMNQKQINQAHNAPDWLKKYVDLIVCDQSTTCS